ncbi:MAG: hypothetical protein STHCBS139747_002003 [Sporothrix thermara]
MPRFSFPVPGRRHKQETATVPPQQLNKVQKLLGSTQIHAEPAIPIITPVDTPKHWDTVSNSCISVNISDSAFTYDDESQVGALPQMPEGFMVGGGLASRRFDGYEEESGVLPRQYAENDDELSITDASSLRRKQSGSTIMSYYDKSKVPLGISQQTSNSAMAKGLPTKAGSLLDIDGSISQASSRKKKPSKLDLSKMFVNRKSSSATLNLNAERGLVLGPDMITRSPSFMSASPLEYIKRPHSGHRSDRRTRPTTGGSSQEEAGLQNLYEHYEQMTFRDVFDKQEDTPSDATTPLEGLGDDMMSPLSPTAVPQNYQEAIAATDAREYPIQVTREALLYKDISAYLGGYPNADAIPQAQASDVLPTIQAPDGDCSRSVSSRYSRTSKASKWTTPSLPEVDLLQTSVLSLSSDSEDDFVDSRPPKTTSTSSSLAYKRSQPEMRSTLPRSLSSDRKQNADRNSGRSDTTVHHLPVPGLRDSQTGPLLPATAYSRDSSASASTSSTTKPQSHATQPSSRNSRISIASNKTTYSATGTVPYTVHEARAITLIPAQGASYNPAMLHAASSDQLTPPLSPSSMDFMLRSNHTSLYDGDQGSIRSAAGSFSAESSRSSNAGQGRYMAVTRQEELLLAALRKKRIRMRESVISEFEEEQGKEKAGSKSSKSRSVRESRRRSIDAVLEPISPPSRSTSQASIRFNDYPMHFEDSPFPVPPSVGIRNSLRCSSAMSGPLSPVFSPPTAQLPPTPGSKSTVTNPDLDRVLLKMHSASALGKAYSSSGSGTGSGRVSRSASSRSTDIYGGGERSSRFSDCVSYGDEDDIGSTASYDSTGQSPIAASRVSRQTSRRHQTAAKSAESKSRVKQRSSLGADSYRSPNYAQKKTLPTVHDSDADGDDYSTNGGNVPSILSYDGFSASGSSNSYSNSYSNSNISTADTEEQGIPRPDSPVESTMVFHNKKSAVRISAVGGSIGRMGAGSGW